MGGEGKAVLWGAVLCGAVALAAGGGDTPDHGQDTLLLNIGGDEPGSSQGQQSGQQQGEQNVHHATKQTSTIRNRTYAYVDHYTNQDRVPTTNYSLHGAGRQRLLLRTGRALDVLRALLRRRLPPHARQHHRRQQHNVL